VERESNTLKGREPRSSSLDELVPFNEIEGILEIDLEQCHLGILVLRQGIAQRVTTSTPPGHPTP